jgi:curved DNA-binding protein CbpA
MALPPPPDEDVDLPLEHRQYLLDVSERLDGLSHYELLGVARAADASDIKRAYFKLARVVHPDRYFGKKLGRYKARLEAVFARMTLAYETLSKPEARAAYDAAQAAAPTNAQAAPPASAPVDPATAARREAALAELKQRLGESKQRGAQQAQVHAQAAARALAAGDVETAAAGYREALKLAPDDAALRAAAAQAETLALARRCEATRRQAALEERHGHWAEAAASWQRLLAIRPDDAEAGERLAAARTRAAARAPT